MDLCLRGSQINLVERQKPRPKYSSQTNLYQPPSGNNPNNYNTRARPRSAQFFTKRSRSSPFLNRPQSAELSQFGAGACVGAVGGVGRISAGSCGQYHGRGGEYVPDKLNKTRRYQSISSSSLLKLLLDEPIKRSWLCRGSVSSPETQSEESSARKQTPAYLDYNKRTSTEITRNGSAESGCYRKTHKGGIENNRFTMSASTSRLSSGNSVSSFSREKSAGSTASTSSLRTTDYWNTNTTTTHTSMLQKQAKPDLPGRVSFSKPNAGLQYEPEPSLSDCENDMQQPHEFSATTKNSPNNASISEPGPVTLPAAVSFSSKPEFAAPTLTCGELSTSAGAKKSVHFGAPADGEGILAETYEYPKCPSENCSCSTRSSSTASSTQDIGAEGKCTCDSATCKLSAERMLRRSSLTDIDDKMDFTLKNELQKKNTVPEELQVIRDYKSVVGDQLENSVVKQILEEDKTKFGGYDNSNNTLEMPAYLDKYVSPTKSNVYSDKPNNLSEAKPSTNLKNGAKKNLVGTTANEFNKMDNNLENNFKSQTTYTPSDTVINNYLKVAATTPLIIKKKENNRPNSGEKQVQNSGNKSTTTAPKNQATNSKINGNAKLKKATSFSSLREDSNLTEFNIDKVDSWMSMHGESMNQRKTLSKHKSLDADFEKFTGGELEEDGHREDILDEHADSASQVSTKSDGESTYDEIVSVIKEIDEDKKKDNYAERAANELELKLNTTPDMVTLPASSGEKTDEASKSPDKYKDILSYLDTVEDSCDRTLLETRRSIPESNRSEIEFVVEPDVAEDVPKLADLLMLPNHQLARRVIALSLRANELANAVYLSKEHVMKVRTEKQKGIRTEKANSANRLREQKKHYEAIVKRHQGFIEQLLKDKGSLCEKVAALTRRLESQNQAWEHKLETEVARVKETTLAGEKIRRERWVRENTKKIKELTVKGLEAEINKMTCNHQRVTTELKQAHQQQLLDALEEARLKHEQIENSIRESCAQDRESIIEKERLAIRERFERQLEEERKCFDEQRQKLVEDFNAERTRLQNELKMKDADFQARRQELQREKELELEQTVAELQEKMFKQEEKYQNRINTIEKQYEADFELWKRDYENECKVSQVEKENAIRQHYRAERDRQIDAIVSRMDAEALKHADEHEAKLNRLKEKYEKDLQLVENAERSLREKFTDTRSSLAEADAKVRNSEAEIKQLKMELEHSKKMCNDFLADRDQLRDNLRNEIQSEVAVIKSERDNEIQKIHKRVQQAIEKKDATIDLLQKENGSLRERCLKLEAVIRQQRKDYCVK
uniref:5-azacytidine-induced protein 1 n=1 Tax=Zeugodacus cucurbitae TaxID=28588 RepID=A0A0A1XT81_ZEUCU